MGMIRQAPPALVECPACNGTGNKIESDERGTVPEPAKKIGSVHAYQTVCGWCAGCGRLLNRKADEFFDAMRTANAARMLVEKDDD